MRLLTVMFVLCMATLASLWTLTHVDPGIAVGPEYEFVGTCWAYLEFVILGVGTITLMVGIEVARRCIRDSSIGVAVVGLAIAIVIVTVSIPASEHLTQQYELTADSLFASARKNAGDGEFGKAAAIRKREITDAIASDIAVTRRIRALPRYSLYDYEIRSKEIPEAIIVSMSIERGQPKLRVNLPVDLVPSFAEIPAKGPS